MRRAKESGKQYKRRPDRSGACKSLRDLPEALGISPRKRARLWLGSTEKPLRNLCFDRSILPSVKNRKFHSAISTVLLAIAVAPFAHGQTAQTYAKPQLAVIDTDIGDDIDDAFAVALALHSSELHILGITTAYGDTELRARLLDRYLGAIGRADIPVAAGVATPQNNIFTQAAYAHHAPERKHPNAVAFLLDQIRAYPGQITLIAIGPLFNIQVAIERDPITFRRLRRVVIMGGSIYRGYGNDKSGSPRPPEPEWNIRCDPAGAQALQEPGAAGAQLLWPARSAR